MLNEKTDKFYSTILIVVGFSILIFFIIDAVINR